MNICRQLLNICFMQCFSCFFLVLTVVLASACTRCVAADSARDATCCDDASSSVSAGRCFITVSLYWSQMTLITLLLITLATISPLTSTLVIGSYKTDALVSRVMQLPPSVCPSDRPSVCFYSNLGHAFASYML